MFKTGANLGLKLTEMKRFFQSQKSKMLERKETSLMSSNLAGYYMYFLLYVRVCLFAIPCRAS